VSFARGRCVESSQHPPAEAVPRSRASAAGPPGLEPLARQQRDQLIPVVALELEGSVLHRSSSAAGRFQSSRQRRQRSVVEVQTGHHGHRLAAAATDLAADAGDAVAARLRTGRGRAAAHRDRLSTNRTHPSRLGRVHEATGGCALGHPSILNALRRRSVLSTLFCALARDLIRASSTSSSPSAGRPPFVRSARQTSVTGKANAQAVSQAPIHSCMKVGTRPTARNVEMPETMKDISPERIRPNSIGAYFLGIKSRLRGGRAGGKGESDQKASRRQC